MRVAVAGGSAFGQDDALARAVEAADAVINLAGSPIGPGRWTRKRKQEIADSRLGVTTRIARAIRSSRRPPSAAR